MDAFTQSSIMSLEREKQELKTQLEKMQEENTALRKIIDDSPDIVPALARHDDYMKLEAALEQAQTDLAKCKRFHTDTNNDRLTAEAALEQVRLDLIKAQADVAGCQETHNQLEAELKQARESAEYSTTVAKDVYADLEKLRADYDFVKKILDVCGREEMHMREENRKLLPENRELKKQLEQVRETRDIWEQNAEERRKRALKAEVALEQALAEIDKINKLLTLAYTRLDELDEPAPEETEADAYGAESGVEHEEK